MIKGMKLTEQMDMDSLFRAKCVYGEVPYRLLLDGTMEDTRGIFVEVVSTDIEELLREGIDREVDMCKRVGAEFLVVETEGTKDITGLLEYLKKIGNRVGLFGIRVCLENGYYRDKGGLFRNGLTSEEEFTFILDELNQSMEKPVFFAALNLGHGKLMGSNLPEMILSLGKRLKLVHINDNNGTADMHELPYTFTNGKEVRPTDWHRIVRNLAKIHFHGAMILDVAGYFTSMPLELQKIAAELVMGIADEWEKQITFEERLKQSGKQLILFGAGDMFRGYMKYWGKQYPPAFVVDNNMAIWGESRLGIKIYSPRRLLDIPNQERNVLICNMYYKEIMAQIGALGIEADWYDEWYWRD